MSMMRTAAAAAGLLTLAACQSSGATPSGPGDPVVAVRDGQTTLRPGQTVAIALPNNGSTGYAWSLADFDETVLMRSEPFGQEATDAHPAGMVGVPGQTHWRLVALAPGQTTLIFNYTRPWEAGAPAAETARFAITVR